MLLFRFVFLICVSAWLAGCSQPSGTTPGASPTAAHTHAPGESHSPDEKPGDHKGHDHKEGVK